MNWDSILVFVAGALTCLVIISIGIALGTNLTAVAS